MSARSVGVVALVATVMMAVAALVPATASAQAGPDPAAIEIVDSRIADDGTVTLTVATPPQAGPDLADAFSVVENGEPVEVVAAEPVGQVPLAVVLVVDTSGSIAGEPLAAAQRAAVTFQETVDDDVAIGVVTAGAPVSVLARPTTDRSVTEFAIGSLSAEGETFLYDALYVAGTMFDDSSGPVRRSVVVLTDGADTNSLAAPETAVESLAGVDAELDVIALDTPDQDLEALGALVEQADGRLVVAPDQTSLESTYQTIATQLINRWEVSYPTQSRFDVASVEVTLELDDEVLLADDDLDVPASLVAADGPPPAVDEPPAVTGPEPYVIAAPGGFANSDAAPWVAAVAVVLALGLAAWVVVPRRRDSWRALGPREDPVEAVGGLRERASAVGDFVAERAGIAGRLDALLAGAAVELTVGELLSGLCALVFVGMALGLVIGSPVLGLLVAASGPAIVLALLARSRAVRRKRFAEQLADTLAMVAGSLRSGVGISAAIEAISEDVPSPMSDELSRATLETRLGRSLEEALSTIGERMESRDFLWIADSIAVQREIGGNLAHTFDKVAETIRKRQRFRRQVQALTAEGRISAIVLLSLPIGLPLMLYTTNPEYMEPLFTETRGQAIIGVAVGLLLAGGAWLKKMIEPEV